MTSKIMNMDQDDPIQKGHTIERPYSRKKVMHIGKNVCTKQTHTKRFSSKNSFHPTTHKIPQNQWFKVNT